MTDRLKLFLVTASDANGENQDYFVTAHDGQEAIILWKHQWVEIEGAERGEDVEFPDDLRAHEVPAVADRPRVMAWTE